MPLLLRGSHWRPLWMCALGTSSRPFPLDSPCPRCPHDTTEPPCSPAARSGISAMQRRLLGRSSPHHPRGCSWTDASPAGGQLPARVRRPRQAQARYHDARLRVPGRRRHRRGLPRHHGLRHLVADRQKGDRDQPLPPRHHGRRRCGLPVLAARPRHGVPPLRAAQRQAHHRARGQQDPGRHHVPVPRPRPQHGHHGRRLGPHRRAPSQQARGHPTSRALLAPTQSM